MLLLRQDEKRQNSSKGNPLAAAILRLRFCDMVSGRAGSGSLCHLADEGGLLHHQHLIVEVSRDLSQPKSDPVLELCAESKCWRFMPGATMGASLGRRTIHNLQPAASWRYVKANFNNQHDVAYANTFPRKNQGSRLKQRVRGGKRSKICCLNMRTSLLIKQETPDCME